MKPDLTVCENVGFEMRDDVPGLAFSQKNSTALFKVWRNVIFEVENEKEEEARAESRWERMGT